MRTRLPASERTSQRIRELRERIGEGDAIGELMRLGIRELVEKALEEEVEDALGRGYYARGEAEPRGYRNGHRTGRIATAEGEVEFSVPQVRDTAEPFTSRVRAELPKRTEALEDLAVGMYARGLSTRDIEATFCDAKGRSLLSRTAVSKLTERLSAEYEAFATRDLSEHEIVYLFADGICERLRAGERKEPALCAWGICRDGQKVLLALTPGTKEDTESCRSFFQDLKRRGLRDPLLVATDGGAGLIRAADECFPRAARQRCLAHRMRNLQAKVPESAWPEFKARALACYQAPSPEVARMLRTDFISHYERELPTAVACFNDDFDACIAQLRFPITHRRSIRTTNLLERLFGEERRRMKIVANAFGERPVLKLMYASLIRGSERWRGLKVGAFALKQLDALRIELDDTHRRQVAPATTRSDEATPSRISSKKGT